MFHFFLAIYIYFLSSLIRKIDSIGKEGVPGWCGEGEMHTGYFLKNITVRNESKNYVKLLTAKIN